MFVYEIRAQDCAVETHKITTHNKTFNDKLHCFHEGDNSGAIGTRPLEGSVMALNPFVHDAYRNTKAVEDGLGPGHYQPDLQECSHAEPLPIYGNTGKRIVSKHSFHLQRSRTTHEVGPQGGGSYSITS